ncbi:MAG: hypothetical protein LBQ22_12545 [Bacteroidales bacterium]|jgi:3-hydroxyacyl-[acyl-carrier-protein] dehydratase|nr:hypothetical protein [Bacteroidales bacterium]
MLKDKFFSIINYSGSDAGVDFLVKFNKEHEIYEAHFPNNPITPGVCVIQVIKELFSHMKQEKFMIKKIKSVKFTYPINPLIHPEVNYNLIIEAPDDENIYQIKATVYSGDVVFSKINLQLLPE